MGIRSILSKPLAAYIARQTRRWSLAPHQSQQAVFQDLINQGRKTLFGREHDFDSIRNYADFRQRVPIGDYEVLRPYIERVKAGEPDILWPGRPAYFGKTSGTTSGTKYIPITKDSIPNHINSARNALLSYIHETGKARFLDGKLIFLSGSPVLDTSGAIPTGRLSGIVNHHVPGYLRTNQLPSWETNIIEDWEEKVEQVIVETIDQPMSLISGIPPWVQMYFDRIVERTGKPIKEVFPQFDMFVYGGVNFEPYRARLYETIGRKVPSIETYPASEGFIAYQDSQAEQGLLMLLHSGIFFEFIPLDEYFQENPRRLSIEEVELGVNYALILNNNAGLWGYSIGDTVKFVSKDPYRLLVTGRVKHFISAFGEHVIGEEVERAMRLTQAQFPETEINEFSVAPYVTPPEGLPHHEWYIAFVKAPHDMAAFAHTLDEHLQKINSYYYDLVFGAIMKPLVIKRLSPNGFQEYMKSIGKLGGQNKVPRLSNDRKIAEALQPFLLADH